ncbi:hypothetical protein [Streptomyces roseochromogenus]|uniref:DUF3558 domain-containing protein n=1 Tax=Streptomyces roseochromogenus subsp. oscitans DS 12.976 TaxID=1352936 RepID=V6KGW4_STRRC|nr:hypothetical protein [Streptomyces roseochromogenus]EST30666.1 hypothetical protein M878_18285 [Streptomyces roseochromogenus subsp. oscitans DS 12.976]
MQRKAYVTGTAAVLAALLVGCTSGSGGGSTTDNENPGDAGTTTVAAQPGKYRTLPEPCGAVGHDTLDSMLGIKQIPDPDQRDKAYQGQAELTYDTDRKVGCHWKVDSADATDRLSVDFERVVSYDNSVSDDDQAQKLFADKETAADLPEPSGSSSASGSPTPTSASVSASASTPSSSPTSSPSASGSPSHSASAGASGSGSPSGSPSPDASAADLQPRVLSGLGDEAYIDDQLGSSGSTAEQRTVTVVFRTSNVVVTIEYEEQPTATGTVPDSKEMQDRARDLASQLDDTLGG